MAALGAFSPLCAENERGAMDGVFLAVTEALA